MNFDYYFFDLDGTLTDPALGITNSFVYALTQFGIEIPSYEKLCSFIGPPLPLTFKKEFGFTAIMVTHDLVEAKAVSDVIIKLNG